MDSVVEEEENVLTDSITIDEMDVVDSQGQLIEVQNLFTFTLFINLKGVQHEDTNGQVIYVSDKGIYQNYDKVYPLFTFDLLVFFKERTRLIG